MTQIYHHTGDNADIALLGLNHDKGYCRVLNLICQLTGYLGACLSQDLSGLGIYHIFSQHMAGDTVAKHQLLIELIASYLRQIISSRIEEHAHDQALCAVHGQRLTRTNLLIQLQKTFLIALCGILGQSCQDLRLLTEQIDDLRIRSVTQSTNQNGYRNLSGTVYTYIKYIVGICLILQPCTTVRDNGTGVKAFS